MNGANKWRIGYYEDGNDADEVKSGLMLGMSYDKHRSRGGFLARTMAKIFNGAVPAELDPIFQHPP